MNMTIIHTSTIEVYNELGFLNFFFLSRILVGAKGIGYVIGIVPRLLVGF